MSIYATILTHKNACNRYSWYMYCCCYKVMPRYSLLQLQLEIYMHNSSRSEAIVSSLYISLMEQHFLDHINTSMTFHKTWLMVLNINLKPSKIFV